MPTAVLVHGAWSSPADWRLVAERLQDRDIPVVIPDLPSHRDREADRSDDAREVESAIRSASPPVAVAGWSYGGAVISELAWTEGIGRLIYVASSPKPPEDEPTDLSGIPHLLFPDEATFVFDGDGWLRSEEAADFPDVLRRYLREHPRRPMTRSAFTAAGRGEAWRSLPTTILIGRSDDGISEERQQWLLANFDDVRIVDGDHFLLLLRPDLVADVIAETFADST